MRFLKVLAIAALIFSLSANAAIAAPEVTEKPKQEQTEKEKKGTSDFRKKKVEFDGQQDPVKMMEEKKEHVREMLKEGKIDKEKADEITRKIDARIGKIKEFNSLTLPEKKAALLKKHKEYVEMMVKEGKMTQKEAEKLTKKFTEELEKWDGSGYPRFFKKGCHGKRRQEKETN